MPTVEEMVTALRGQPPAATHEYYPPGPDVISPLMAFATGGVHGLAKQRGYETPEWSDKLATALQNPEFNTAIGTFGGTLAKTADLAALKLAQSLEGQGITRSDIWGKTGWGRGVDDRWRFEIPDVNATQVAKNMPDLYAQAAEQRVGDVFGHPNLYAAYPQLSSYPFSRNTAMLAKGHFDPSTKEIAVASPWIAGTDRSVMLHELQHGVQNIEGFAPGSNPSFLARTNLPENPEWIKWKAAQSHPAMQEYNKLHVSPEYNRELFDQNRLWREEYQPRLRELETGWVPRGNKAELERRSLEADALFDHYKQAISGKFPVTERLENLHKQLGDLQLPRKEPRKLLTPDEAYKASAGEVEARNVQHRMDWGEEKRRGIPPWYTEDMQRSQQILPPNWAMKDEKQRMIEYLRGQ